MHITQERFPGQAAAERPEPNQAPAERAEAAKVYLASRYSRNPQMREIREQLAQLGHVVTSRWIDGDHQINDAGLSDQARAEERTRFAMEDWEDLLGADWVISFTEEPRKTTTRGGRHVEYGAALALGKRVIVVGYRENVFHCLPQVEFFASQWDMLYALAAESEASR